MNKTDISIWSNLTFKTRAYRKNYDLITDDENIITEYDGTVGLLRLGEKKSPLIIGEYGFSVWNIELGKMLGIDFNKLLFAHRIEDTYDELRKAIADKLIDITEYRRVVLIHSLMLRADARKHGISEEFVEMIYRDFYDESYAIIALVKPFQNNPIDADYYFERKSVIINDVSCDVEKADNIPATEYYSLNELVNKNDREFNEYKLFSVASRCGFSRIGESYLFKYSPDQTIERLMDKVEMLKEFNQ